MTTIVSLAGLLVKGGCKLVGKLSRASFKRMKGGLIYRGKTSGEGGREEVISGQVTCI